jgi:transmembrane sensor
MTIDPTLRDAAVHWAVRTGDPAFADWEAFTVWLEADPAHARAYDEVSAAVSAVAEAGLPEILVAANDNAEGSGAPFGVPRRAWLGGALTAALALFVFIGVPGLSGGSTYVTDPGEMRTIALDDGSSITLGGDTRLVLRDGDERVAVLEQGQALFDLRHDADRPFEVRAGEDVLRDIGTVFEVERRGATTSLAVSEGAVLFNPAREKLTVSPGQRAVRRGGAGRIETSAIPTALVGEWRQGRHTFRDATLAEVAAALSGASGVRFAVSPGAAEQRISGSVLIDPIRRDPTSLGPLLGLKVRSESDERWVLEP